MEAMREELATVAAYDEALRSLTRAVTTMFAAVVAESSPVKFVTNDEAKRSLGLYPPMIALGDAVAEAMLFRSRAGAGGALPPELRENFETGYEKRRELLMMMAKLSSVEWPELASNDELSEGGTD